MTMTENSSDQAGCQPARGVAAGGAELAARTTAAAAVLADYRADLASAPLTSPPPMAVWAQRLSRALDDILRAPGGHLTDGQRDVLGHALADAIENNERGLDGFCAGCDAAPSALCADHAADLDRADSYRVLARDLGIEVDPETDPVTRWQERVDPAVAEAVGDGPLPIRLHPDQPAGPGVSVHWLHGRVLVVGIYTTDRQGTVYRWQDGLGQPPAVIHWNLDGPPCA